MHSQSASPVMPLSEFSLIERYFTRQSTRRDEVILGIGDDAALLKIPPDRELAVAIDTLVEGRHFPMGTDPRAIAYKALAVNLSDMAAMGAEPAWMTLSLSLPQAEPDFLDAFASGLFHLADQYQVQLIGGDTVRGPLTVSVQLAGYVEPGRALRRDGARAGDVIYVTGTLGDAGAALAVILGELDANEAQQQYLRQRLDYPTPRVDVGMAISGLATAAIDISDGLAADLGHILEASAVGALLDLERLPLSTVLCEVVGEGRREHYALSSGDDYELCFTVPADKQPALEVLSAQLDCPVTRIGVIEASEGLRVRQKDGAVAALSSEGFDHFSGETA